MTLVFIELAFSWERAVDLDSIPDVGGIVGSKVKTPPSYVRVLVTGYTVC